MGIRDVGRNLVRMQVIRRWSKNIGFGFANMSQQRPLAQQPRTGEEAFPLFNYLQDELKMEILSFVADAPFEGVGRSTAAPKSSLTHVWPHVSRKFRSFSNQDCFWKDALIRQTMAEPFLWKDALHRILKMPFQPNSSSSSNDGNDEEDEKMDTGLVVVEKLVQEAFERKKYTKFKQMYRDIVSYHLRFLGPVFYMCGQVSLGQPYSLHFFEPRYRVLIAEVMQDQPEEAKRGGRIVGDACLFIHANRGPLAPTTPATLVQVISCEILPDGRANVVLLPVAFVWLERLWVKPNSNHLYYAQCLRMGQDVTNSMNHLGRQEQLAYVMSQLTSSLSEEPMSGSGSEVE